MLLTFAVLLLAPPRAPPRAAPTLLIERASPRNSLALLEAKMATRRALIKLSSDAEERARLVASVIYTFSLVIKVAAGVRDADPEARRAVEAQVSRCRRLKTKILDENTDLFL